MKAVAAIMLMCFAINLPTSQSLRKNYGAPVAETYLVRPGVVATAKYSQGGKICSLTVASDRRPTSADEKQRSVSVDVLRAVAEELVPPSERGRLVDSGFLNLTCVRCESTYGSYENYEKVRVRISGGGQQKEEALIEWKDVACQQ